MQFLKRECKRLIVEEMGDETLEFAIIFPIILLVVGFIIDRFIQYEGLTSLTVATNEAIRTAVVAEDESDAKDRIKEILSDRLKTSQMGWCTGTGNNCKQWGSGDIAIVDNKDQFASNPNAKLYVYVDNGWCNGSYMTVGVRAHKSSVFPSYESFRQKVSKGGALYHSHTYIVSARVEAKDKCS